MSVGPMGGAASFAGSSLAQGMGSELERASHDSQAHQRRVQSQAKAIDAAGIGKTDEDAQTEDRDADGRRLWERQGKPEETTSTEAVSIVEGEASLPHSVKDPTGQSGSLLDLTG